MEQPADTSLNCDPRHKLCLSCAKDPRLLSCPFCRGTLEARIPAPPLDDPTYEYAYVHIYNNQLLTYTDYSTCPDPPPPPARPPCGSWGNVFWFCRSTVVVVASVSLVPACATVRQWRLPFVCYWLPICPCRGTHQIVPTSPCHAAVGGPGARGLRVDARVVMVLASPLQLAGRPGGGVESRCIGCVEHMLLLWM